MKTKHSVYSTPRRVSWIAGLLILILSSTSITACSDEPTNNGSDTGIVDDTDQKPDTEEPDVGLEDVDVVDDTDNGNPDVPVIPDDAVDDTTPDDVDVVEDTDTGPNLPDVPVEVLLTIDAIEPNRGSVDGGTAFTIKGTSFTADTEVFFGARRVMTELVDSKLRGETPGASGVGPVNIKLLDPVTGGDTLVGGFTYTAPLEIFKVSPALLPSTGDVEVTIEGFGFTADTRISFGGHTASRHTMIDNTLMRVIAPAHAPGVEIGR